MTTRFGAAFLLTALIAAPAALAEQKPHLHGHWQLNAAIEDNRLQVELIAPGADVVGFEHEARTAAEKAKVWKAKEKLKAGDALIILPAAAGCVLSDAHADIASLGEDHHHKNGHSAHGNQAKNDDDTHNEYHAEYVFTCSNVSELKTINVAIFDAFPATEKVKAAVLTGKGQHAAELVKDNTVIRLDGLF